jgi:hypothetical protein
MYDALIGGIIFPIRQRPLDHRHCPRRRRAMEPIAERRMGSDAKLYPIAMDEH